MIKVLFNDIELGTATGFQVQRGHKFLVTNWHVVSGRNFITKECLNKNGAIPNKLIVRYKQYKDTDSFEWVETTIDLYDDNEHTKWYEHPFYKSNVDVVVIPLEMYPPMEHYDEAFELETLYNLEVTENVFVLGFPLGFTIKNEEEPHAIWTLGTVASDPDLNLKVKKIDYELPAFLIDSKTRQGQSGSPVIYYSKEGIDTHSFSDSVTIWGVPFMKEIGIYSGRIHKDSDLGIVWKWYLIREILDSVDI